MKPLFAILNLSHRITLFTTVLVASMTLTGSAFAGNVHLVGNKINFLDEGVDLESTFKLGGLGYGDITVLLEVEVTVGIVVLNPGNNEPPGQQVPLIVSGAATIPNDQIKNGTVTVTVSTVPVEKEDVDVDLNNPNWDFFINDITFESATITVIQNGAVVFQRTFEL